MPVGGNPVEELAPGLAETLVRTVINRLRHLHGGPLARLYPARGSHPRADGRADFKIPRGVGDLEVVVEPGARRLDALSGNRGHQFTEAGTHHILNLSLWNLEVNDSGLL